MLQEVVLYLTQLVQVVGFQGGEVRVRLSSLHAVLEVSPANPWPPTMAGKECKAECCGCQSRNVDHSRS